MLALAACGNSGEITRISEELKLTDAEVRAFRICVREMTGKKLPVFVVAGKQMRMTRVPVEVSNTTRAFFTGWRLCRSSVTTRNLPDGTDA